MTMRLFTTLGKISDKTTRHVGQPIARAADT